MRSFLQSNFDQVNYLTKCIWVCIIKTLLYNQRRKNVRQLIKIFILQVDRVIFTLFLEKDVDIYEKQMQLFFPVEEKTKNIAAESDGT